MSPACSLITLTSGDIEYTQNLTIDGPGASTLAVSGNNESPIFVGDGASETTVSGLTLEDAKGAISAGGSLTVTDANFSDNSESAGGAISFNGNGTFTVTGSTFTHNASTDSAARSKSKAATQQPSLLPTAPLRTTRPGWEAAPSTTTEARSP